MGRDSYPPLFYYGQRDFFSPDYVLEANRSCLLCQDIGIFDS